MNINKLIIASMLLGSVATSASAAIISELEANGTASNNTLATAQLISAASFTPNVSANVFGTLPTVSIQGKGGNNDVDFFSFVSAGGKVNFDIDNATRGFDTLLSLFNSSGTLIAFGDDTVPLDAGSTSTSDAFLGSINLGVGTYFVAVTEFNNLPNSLGNCSGFTDLIRPDNAIGGTATSGCTVGDSSFSASGRQNSSSDYLLHISTSVKSGTVPEPATLLLMGMGGIGFFARKRKSEKNA